MRSHPVTIAFLLCVAFRSAGAVADSRLNPPVPVVHVAGHAGHAGLPDTVHAVVQYTLSHDVPFIDLHVGPNIVDSTTAKRDAVEYRAMVESHGDRWMTVNDHRLRLPNLGPGSHTVRLQARYAGMEWGKEVRVQLNVNRSPMAALMTYAIVGMSLTISGWGVATMIRRNRERRMAEDEQIRLAERRRIARDLHDDVNAGLARIVVLSDAVAAQREPQGAAATIAETAREVIDNVRSIVWVMRADDDSTSTMLKYIGEKIGELLSDHGIEFVFEDEDCDSCRLSSEVRWNVLMCIKEIAMNIIRHSDASRVALAAVYRDGYLNISICDDGVGFDSVHAGPQGGLGHIRSRMAEIGGTAGIGSSPGQGTNILLVIPVAAHRTTAAVISEPTSREAP